MPLSVAAREAREHLHNAKVRVPSSLFERLAEICPVDTDADAIAEHSRDWWPLSLHWAHAGEIPARPAAVVRPETASQVSQVLEACSQAEVPVTPAAGRSGVCGGSVPVFGGIVLDCCGLVEPFGVDETSMLVESGAGKFGPDLEARLREEHHLTVGHFPQSFAISTVGGWLACRGAGQYSTRYGKIEDIVAGLEVVLADGTRLCTGSLQGAGPRSATGPDLTQLFVGSEGALGIITRAALRARPLPPCEQRSAFSFTEFAHGLDALRRTLRRGATPAVVRLYDRRESLRIFGADTNLLIVLDEGDRAIVQATMTVVDDECSREGSVQDVALVDKWLADRNDVGALASLTEAGIVVDTVEVSARWSVLAQLYEEVVRELQAIEGCLVASAHESHAYSDGACLYFTFAGRSPGESGDIGWMERFYNAAWSLVMRCCLRHGASISHHHGVGLVRSRFMAEALGDGFGVLSSLKRTLDPKGILNPGKLGLASRYGSVSWPSEAPR